jgi:hypothetical protein
LRDVLANAQRFLHALLHAGPNSAASLHQHGTTPRSACGSYCRDYTSLVFTPTLHDLDNPILLILCSAHSPRRLRLAVRQLYSFAFSTARTCSAAIGIFVCTLFLSLRETDQIDSARGHLHRPRYSQCLEPGRVALSTHGRENTYWPLLNRDTTLIEFAKSRHIFPLPTGVTAFSVSQRSATFVSSIWFSLHLVPVGFRPHHVSNAGIAVILRVFLTVQALMIPAQSLLGLSGAAGVRF